jgi:hypothetical protein
MLNRETNSLIRRLIVHNLSLIKPLSPAFGCADVGGEYKNQ